MKTNKNILKIDNYIVFASFLFIFLFSLYSPTAYSDFGKKSLSNCNLPQIELANSEYSKLTRIDFDLFVHDGNRLIKCEKNVIPESVILFTSKLIDSYFFNNPSNIADRFYGTNVDNYSSLVNFVVVFTPTFKQTNKNEIWEYLLRVQQIIEQDKYGKSFLIQRVMISNNSRIIYGRKTNPYSWVLPNQEYDYSKGSELFLDIITDPYNGNAVKNIGRVTKYLYDPKLDQLNKVEVVYDSKQ